MDPNAALELIREIIKETKGGDDLTSLLENEGDRAVALIEAISGLDRWLTASGYLPEAWCGASAAPRPGRHAHAIMMPCGPGCPGYIEGRR